MPTESEATKYTDATPAELVYEMVALYLSGVSAEEIADILNDGGAPPPGGTSWTPREIVRKLREFPPQSAT
ncbi:MULTISPECIES: recombinase family protein [Nonomuraea]|uniref:Recombinase family protein n=1 Tax=Nonomuraea mangrovi TaxID=2316207 RepID=A0ABW4TB43_9ACTN